jgi:hypothetical protein
MTETMFQFRSAPLWSSVVSNPGRTSPSPNWQFCSPHVALHNCCKSPSTKSSWFRRFSSTNSRCQSNDDGLHSVNGVAIQSDSRPMSWCSGRARWPRGVRVLPLPPRRKLTRRSEVGVDTSIPITRAHSLLSPSRSDQGHRGRNWRRHCRHSLLRARTSSPSLHRPPNPIHYSANIPSTSFTRCLTRLCRGEGEFRFPPPRVLICVLSA